MSRKRKRRRVSANQLKRERSACQRYRDKIAAAGYQLTEIWMPRPLHASAKQRAQALGVPQGRVITAAFEAGMRHLTMSEIQRHCTAWNGLVGISMMPFRERLKQWNEHWKSKRRGKGKAA